MPYNKDCLVLNKLSGIKTALGTGSHHWLFFSCISLILCREGNHYSLPFSSLICCYHWLPPHCLWIYAASLLPSHHFVPLTAFNGLSESFHLQFLLLNYQLAHSTSCWNTLKDQPLPCLSLGENLGAKSLFLAMAGKNRWKGGRVGYSLQHMATQDCSFIRGHGQSFARRSNGHGQLWDLLSWWFIYKFLSPSQCEFWTVGGMF